MPIVPDFWLGGGADSGLYTTIGNWNQPWRNIVFRGERFTWSKDVEFRKFLELPSRGKAQFELALSSYEQADRDLLESRGWKVRHGLDVSTDLESYRSYLLGSRGEFTVAKDQNVRLKSGWFSDRSAAYLAAGRPVVTQDTGFGCALPTGEGLFAFETMDDIVAAIEAIETDYARARRAAFDVAREYFDAQLVLGQMLEEMGVSLPGARTALPSPLPPTLDLSVVSRRPTTLPAATVETCARAADSRYGRRRLPARVREVSVVVVPADGLPVHPALPREPARRPAASSTSRSSSSTTPRRRHRRATSGSLAERDSRVRVVRNERNRGFAPAVNQGLAAATGSILVVLNNDTIVPPGSLGRPARTIWSDRKPGSSAPITNEAGNEAEVDADYRTLRRAGAVRRRSSVAQHAGTSFDIDVATFFCAAFRRDVWERVGPLDEQFEVGMFEDDDYARRVRQAGLRVLAAEDVFVHHFGEASFGHLFESGERSRIFEANKTPLRGEVGRDLGAARPAAQRLVPRPGRADPGGRRPRAATRRHGARRLERRRRAPRVWGRRGAAGTSHSRRTASGPATTRPTRAEAIAHLEALRDQGRHSHPDSHRPPSGGSSSTRLCRIG